VGGFSYSEGLESTVEAGLADTEAKAQCWLLDQLALALGRADLAVVELLAQWRGASASVGKQAPTAQHPRDHT